VARSETYKIGRSLLCKVVASAVLLTFTLSSVTPNNSFAYAEPLSGGISPSHGVLDPGHVLDSFTLPDTLGRIHSKFIPNKNPEKLVIYLQDAHGNFDSARHIQQVIQTLQKDYGVSLVLLEGGEGKLDTLFFKAFPKDELKEKLLTEYLKRSDLTGAEVAAILGERSKARYYGIDSQVLYDENEKAFLEAYGREDEVLEILLEIEDELEEKIKQGITPNVKTFHTQHKAFGKEEIDFIEYVNTLKDLFVGARSPRPALGGVTPPLRPGLDHSAFRTPHPAFGTQFPQLSKILTAKEENRVSSDGEVIQTNRMVKAFKEKVIRKLPKPTQMEANQLIQMYQIGQLSRGMLVSRLKDLSKKHNFFFDVPRALQPEATQAKTLTSIKGTKLFKELEALEDQLRQTLPQSEEERNLLKDFYHVGLLNDLARLELTRKKPFRGEEGHSCRGAVSAPGIGRGNPAPTAHRCSPFRSPFTLL